MARKPRHSDHEVHQGVVPEAGVPYCPSDQLNEEALKGTRPSRSVSHRGPIDPSEYAKLKEQAAKGGRKQAEASQEDASAPPGDEDD